MKKIYIWGAGYYLQQVVEEIDITKVCIEGIVDSDEKKQGEKFFNTIPVVSPNCILEKNFDYVVISVKNYKQIENQCITMGIRREKIIIYWNEGYKENIFKSHIERIEELMNEKKQFQYYLDSLPYEWGIKQVPNIRKGTELLKKIIAERGSMCRFGDGEFEMIRDKKRPWFQKPNHLLGKRLKEIFITENDFINIAISQNFCGLDQYKEEVANEIRNYMYGDTRKYILGLVNMDRVYYDAYVTRPYIIYKEKKNADKIFPLFKKVWENRDVVIVEGKYSRIGVGNDLFFGASSVRRIICPFKNAWDVYGKIIRKVKKSVSNDNLICISLGPCATVLAFDLAKEGYQALDIGQLDNEYEWYLRGAKDRIEIPGKMVAEILKEQKLELNDEIDYVSQIMEIIR